MASTLRICGTDGKPADSNWDWKRKWKRWQ